MRYNGVSAKGLRNKGTRWERCKAVKEGEQRRFLLWLSRAYLAADRQRPLCVASCLSPRGALLGFEVGSCWKIALK